MLRRWNRLIKRTVTIATLVVCFAAIAFFVPQEYPVPGAADTRVSRAIGSEGFDFLEWAGDAWLEKGSQVAVPVQDFLTDAQRSQFVVHYIDLTRSWSNLESQVRQTYSDSSVSDPAAATRELRAKRDAVRAEIERSRPTAEAIIQQQIASVLADEGFASGGEVVPPVASRITPLPYVLITSPRDEIRSVGGEGLQTGLSVEQADQIETQVLSTTNQAALVVPIGGLAAYPTMVLETNDLLWLLQTASHEWTHNWLYLRPLGYSYLADSPIIRTINETVANLVGNEVGLKVMRRYYPDVLKKEHPDLVNPQPLQPPDKQAAPASAPPKRDPNVFSFNNALYETRLQVDELLKEARALEKQNKTAEAEAKIVEAETYMDQQRKFINSHGYNIRKLNQAYFAFYGAYADRPGGAAGGDPTGPSVVALRAYSPSLRAFLDRVSSVLTLEQLRTAVAEFTDKR